MDSSTPSRNCETAANPPHHCANLSQLETRVNAYSLVYGTFGPCAIFRCPLFVSNETQPLRHLCDDQICHNTFASCLWMTIPICVRPGVVCSPPKASRSSVPRASLKR